RSTIRTGSRLILGTWLVRIHAGNSGCNSSRSSSFINTESILALPIRLVWYNGRKPLEAPTMAKIAYSYLGYSSNTQADGDSIPRQTELADACGKRNGAKLDIASSYQDHGRSAFRGKHRRSGKLAQFLADVQAARIPGGSILLVENLDRLSRENPWD